MKSIFLKLGVTLLTLSFILTSLTVFAETNTTIYPSKYYNIDSSGKITKHIFANGIEIATIEGSEATVKYLHTDNLGSTSVVSDSSSNVVETTDYFPYGNIRVDKKITSFSEQRKYIGQEYDVDTNLNYLNARYYDSSAGRFLSQDPVFWTPEKILQDPQSMNSYSYARNNPIVNVDPDGKFWFVVPTLIGGAVGGLIGGTVSAISGNGFWQGAKYGAISGAVTGFTISTAGAGAVALGLTSSEALIGSSALGNALGGVVGRASIGQSTDVGNIGLDLAIGGFGGMLGSGYLNGKGNAGANGNPISNSVNLENLSPKIIKQMEQRGWTQDQIKEAVQSGKQVPAVNKATGNLSTRYINPNTGQSVVVDGKTKEVIHVGGSGFKYGPSSGDIKR